MKTFGELYESLWANIHKKRQRIKQGSGEKMRKKGEKGAPTPAQMDRAKGEGVQEDKEDEDLQKMIKIATIKTSAAKDMRRRREQQKSQLSRIKDKEQKKLRGIAFKQQMKSDRENIRRQIQQVQREEAPSLAVLKKKIKSGTKLGSTETSSAKARGLIPRADGTKRKSPKYK